jgi:hypothetical protein
MENADVSMHVAPVIAVVAMQAATANGAEHFDVMVLPATCYR